MPVCHRMKAARAAMPARAMIAPGGPITPWKHIQASQDAAAMNASRNGSAARANRKRQIRKRRAGGASGGRARRACRRRQQMGWAYAYCCPVRQRGAPPCGRETTRFRSEVTGNFGGIVVCRESRPINLGRQFVWGVTSKKGRPSMRPSGARLKAPMGTLPDRHYGSQGPRSGGVDVS